MNPDDVLNPTCLIGGPVVCAAKNGVDSAVSSAASNGFKQAAETMFTAYDDIMKQFLTSWTGSGFLVSLDNKATAWFQDTSLPITIALLTLGLIVAGARVMYSRRGEPFQEVMGALGRAVAVITLGTAASQIFVWGGDAYAQWILKVSGVSATGGYTAAGFAAASPGLALIFGLLGVIAVGLQWVIMFVRQSLLLLLNAFWQISASYALLKRGEQAFEKITAWIIAFIIYTPLAASIYAFAWRLKDGQDGVGGVLYGLMLILLAVVALPAIMRLLIPASGALGSAIGGAMALGVGAAALQAGVAVGAAVATGGASAGAGAGAGTAATTSTSTGVAEGGEMASAGGQAGGFGSDSTPTAGGSDGDASSVGSSGSDGAAGVVGGESASGADGSDGSSGSGGGTATPRGRRRGIGLRLWTVVRQPRGMGGRRSRGGQLRGCSEHSGRNDR
jgi:type IV secretion system protein TrbL